tara:strand:+ start:1004 stop:1231 length:228 start_codon:yes stop_codon:yes gene_type:complete
LQLRGGKKDTEYWEDSANVDAFLNEFAPFGMNKDGVFGDEIDTEVIPLKINETVDKVAELKAQKKEIDDYMNNTK